MVQGIDGIFFLFCDFLCFSWPFLSEDGRLRPGDLGVTGGSQPPKRRKIATKNTKSHENKNCRIVKERMISLKHLFTGWWFRSSMEFSSFFVHFCVVLVISFRGRPVTPIWIGRKPKHKNIEYRTRNDEFRREEQNRWAGPPSQRPAHSSLHHSQFLVRYSLFLPFMEVGSKQNMSDLGRSNWHISAGPYEARRI